MPNTPRNTTMVTETLMTCPACRQPITARLAIGLELQAQALPEGERMPTLPKSLNFTGQVTGLAISHDCIPRTNR